MFRCPRVTYGLVSHTLHPDEPRSILKANLPQQFKARSNTDWVTLFWDEEEKAFSCMNTSPATCQENKPWPIVFISTDAATGALQESQKS